MSRPWVAWGLGAVLLAFVWWYAHWSVAVVLTFLTAATELQAWLLGEAHRTQVRVNWLLFVELHRLQGKKLGEEPTAELVELWTWLEEERRRAGKGPN